MCLLLGFPIAWLYHRGRLASPDAHHPDRPAAAADQRRRTHLCVDRDPGPPGHHQLDAAVDRAIDTPLRLLYTQVGVVVALAQVQMPLMTLPLITALGRIDLNLEDASCFARRRELAHLLARWSLPLSLPGVIAGCTLTYAAAITAFITQSLVGGGQMLFMPMYLYQQASTLQNWPFAAAISIIFLACGARRRDGVRHARPAVARLWWSLTDGRPRNAPGRLSASKSS